MSYIYARDYITNEPLNINIPVKMAYNAGDHTEFAHSKDIYDFADFINSQDYELTTQIYQDEYILIRKELTTNERTAFFLIKSIKKIIDEKENRYFLFPPIAHIRVRDGIDNGSIQNSIDIHIPFHLLKNAEIKMYLPDFYIENEKTVIYETIGTIDDYYDFYTAYAIYDVEKDEDTIIISGGRGINFSIEMEINVFHQDDKEYAAFTFGILKN